MWNKIKSLLFDNTTLRQTVAKNTFWLTVSNFGGRLLRAVIIIYAARILGAEEWGIFSYAISLITLLTVFTDIGISPLLIREASKYSYDPAHQRKVISTSFIVKIMFILVGVAIVLLFGRFFTSIEGVKAILPIAAFVLAFDSMREFGASLIRATERMERETMAFLLTNAAIVAIGFIFFRISETVGAFTYAYALGTGIGMAVTFYAVRDKLTGLFSNFSFPVLKSLLESGWPLTISGILGMLMINTDIILLGWFQSAEDVGLYSAAQRIVLLLYLVPSVITASALPLFSRLANKEDEKLRRILELILSFIFLVAIPIAVGGVILGKPIMEFVFGSAYLAGALSFQILLATILIDFPVTVLNNVAFVYNKQKSLIIYSAIGGISNVIFDFLLIPQFGIAGSAWATLLAQLISVLYLRNVVRKVNNPRIMRHMTKIFISTGIMGIAICAANIIGLHIILSVSIGILVYTGALFALREPLLRDVKNIIPK